MMRCPNCNSYMRFSMEYSCGNPIIIYTCDNCRYTTLDEVYITDNKTTMTTGSNTTTSSTATRFEPTNSVKQNNSANVYTIKKDFKT